MTRRCPRAALLLALVLVLLLAVAPVPAAAEAPPARKQSAPPAQDAAVEGVVTHQDGSPAAGVPVSVVGYDDAGFGGVIATVFTLGFACLADREVCLGTSTDGGEATTGPDGGYRGTLPGSYVAGTETNTDWVVTAALRPAAGQVRGPSSSFEFEVNIALQAAPPLPLWEQTPVVVLDGWQATVSVDGELPVGTDRSEVTIAGPEGSESFRGSTASVDLRRLESNSGAGPAQGFATAYADVRVPHANGRTIYHQAVKTAAVAFPEIDLVPISRSATCSIVNTAANVVPLEGGSCPVTDGNRLSAVAPGTTSVTVDLGPAGVEVGDVFVVGCRNDCTVEVSGDGTTWSALAIDLVDPDLASTPSRPLLVASDSADAVQKGRYLRVTSPAGIDDVTEVSVWPTGPRPAAASPVRRTTTGPGTDVAAPGAAATTDADDDSGDGGSGTLVPAALAALALSAVAAAIGVAWGRRSAG